MREAPRFSPRALAALRVQQVACWPPGRRRLLRALRLHVHLARRGWTVRATANALLGEAGPAFGRLMEAALAAWPEPFLVFPPSTAAATPDETSLLDLLERPEAAGRLLGELLPAGLLDRLAGLAFEVLDDLPLD